jgi:ADP-ribose pyrophosphatase YjhB (NUDIX family)
MPTPCDHTSVGMFVWKGEDLLLIERAKTPFGYAIPAGHVDGDASYEASARRELEEEVGISALSLELTAEGRRENPCRREGGSWHYWKLYTVTWEGELTRSEDETKRAGWYSRAEVQSLADRTVAYREGQLAEEVWQQHPGLEPIMYDWFKELGIIT